MKRYLFSIILAIFSIGGIGIYYVYGAINHFPDYKLVTIEGDEQVGSTIELSGIYFLGAHRISLSVNNKGSEYVIDNRHSVIQDVQDQSWYLNQSDINALVKGNKAFMRGKLYADGLYSDDEWIIYVASENEQISNGRFNVNLQITTFNKNTELTREYEFQLADRDNITIRDVQLVDDQINIISTENALHNNESYVYRYVIDLQLDSPTSFDRLIVGEPQMIDEHNLQEMQVQVSTIANVSSIAPSDYIVLTEVKAKHLEKSIFNQENHSQMSYYAYSYRTEEVFELPVEPTANNKQLKLLIDNVFTYVDYDEEQLIISQYELDTKEFNTRYLSFTAAELGLMKITSTMWLEGNYLFISDRNLLVPALVAIDLSKNQVAYKGQVFYDGYELETEKQIEHLMLYSINTKLQ